MRRFINLIKESVLPPDWDLGGAWITETGEILPCDHANGIHHSHLAFDAYSDGIDDAEIGDDGDPDDASKDIAYDVAYSEGWIRISTRGTSSFCVEWRRKPQKESIKSLLSYLKNNLNFSRYEIEAPGIPNGYETYDDARAFIAGIQKALRAFDK
jgi:hypothetical protein